MGILLSPFRSRAYPPPTQERLILGDFTPERPTSRRRTACASKVGKFRYLRPDICVTRTGTPAGLVQSPSEAVEFVTASYPDMLDAVEERVVLLVLNAQLSPAAIAEVARGTGSASIVPIHEILRLVLLSAGTRFMLFHNHPSEDSTPSMIDMNITKVLTNASAIIQLEFIDHIVVARGNWTSIRSGERRRI